MLREIKSIISDINQKVDKGYTLHGKEIPSENEEKIGRQSPTGKRICRACGILSMNHFFAKRLFYRYIGSLWCILYRPGKEGYIHRKAED